MKKKKVIDIYFISESKSYIRIRQQITENGDVLGIGWFEIQTPLEIEEHSKRIRERRKSIMLASGTFEGGKKYWKLSQFVYGNGKVIGTSSFSFTELTELKKQKAREDARLHRLSTVKNGKSIRIYDLNKRSYSETCEICGKNTHLVYHHWDDNNYSKGIWVCVRCHLIIEIMDKMLSNNLSDSMKTYLIKKSQIEEEFKKK